MCTPDKNQVYEPTLDLGSVLMPACIKLIYCHYIIALQKWHFRIDSHLDVTVHLFTYNWINQKKEKKNRNKKPIKHILICTSIKRCHNFKNSISTILVEQEYKYVIFLLHYHCYLTMTKGCFLEILTALLYANVPLSYHSFIHSAIPFLNIPTTMGSIIYPEFSRRYYHDTLPFFYNYG